MTTPLTKHLYFTTSTVIDWVDIFTRASYRHIVVDSLTYCQQAKGLKIYAWVLMSNHLHMVVRREIQLIIICERAVSIKSIEVDLVEMVLIVDNHLLRELGAEIVEAQICVR